jgi:predicted nucleotidyltransferase
MFDNTVIQEAGRRILDATPAGSRVIVFGSHARGDAGEHSDLDLLVIEPAVQNPARESVRLRRALGDLMLAADVIVTSAEQVSAALVRSRTTRSVRESA